MERDHEAELPRAPAQARFIQALRFPTTRAKNSATVRSTPKMSRCRFAKAGCDSDLSLPARAPQWLAPAARQLLTTLATLVVWTAPWWQTLLAQAQQGVQGQHAEPVAQSPNEYTMKAMFLYSFGRYIEWPETAFRNESEPFVIGIVGKDSFGGALDDIAARKTIQERQIAVRRFVSPAQYKPPCHILFVSRALPAKQQTALIRKTKGTAVFVVGETPGFAEIGGGANFVVEDNQVRFEINIATARQSQLRMDAKLLNLGKPVGSTKRN